MNVSIVTVLEVISYLDFSLRRLVKRVYNPTTVTARHGWKEMIDVA